MTRITEEITLPNLVKFIKIMLFYRPYGIRYQAIKVMQYPNTIIYKGLCGILDVFPLKQTQMYVCTLKEFIRIEVNSLLHNLELIWNGNYTDIYTNILIA